MTTQATTATSARTYIVRLRIATTAHEGFTLDYCTVRFDSIASTPNYIRQGDTLYKFETAHFSGAELEAHREEGQEVQAVLDYVAVANLANVVNWTTLAN